MKAEQTSSPVQVDAAFRYLLERKAFDRNHKPAKVYGRNLCVLPTILKVKTVLTNSNPA